MSIEELDLSVVQELADKSEADMMKVRNCRSYR